MNKKIDIPGFTYFSEKNIYSGSINHVFNFKIYPGEKFSVVLWSGWKCIDKTPEENIIEKKEFEFNSDGLDELISWIYDKYTETQKQTF